MDVIPCPRSHSRPGQPEEDEQISLRFYLLSEALGMVASNKIRDAKNHDRTFVDVHDGQRSSSRATKKNSCLTAAFCGLASAFRTVYSLDNMGDG